MTSEAEIIDITDGGFDLSTISNEAAVKQHMAGLKKKYEVVGNATTKEGYTENKGGVSVLRTLRGKITAWHKAKKAPIILKGKQLDLVKNLLIADIEVLELPMKTANKDQDTKVAEEKAAKAEAEAVRKETIKETIENIRMTPITSMDKDSTQLTAILGSISEQANDLSWAEEYLDKAESVVTETVEKLEQLINAKKGQEEIARQQKVEAERLAKEKKDAEDKAQADREEQDRKNKEKAKKLADDQAKFDAEKKKFSEEKEASKKDAQKKEDARLATIKEEDDKRAAKIKAEKDLEEAKAKAKEDKEKGEALAFANHEAKGSRMDEITSALVFFINDTEVVGRVVEAIVNGEIPHVTFK